MAPSPANELTLTDPAVSHYHLELRCEDGVLVKDLGSRNGTFVGDVRISEAVVPIGTRIRIGRTVLALLDATIAPPEAPPPPPDVPGLVAASRSMQEVGRHRRTAGAVDRLGADPGRDGHRQGAGRARHPRDERRARSSRSSSSICGALPADADRVASCSGTSRARSRARSSGQEGAFELAARRHRSSSTRSASCRWRYSPRCSACSSAARSAALGGKEDIQVDVRVISATHRDLRAEANAGDVPRRSVLPPRGRAHRDPAAARAARGHRSAGRALRRRDHRARPAPCSRRRP